jgi:hypothetical protein
LSVDNFRVSGNIVVNDVTIASDGTKLLLPSNTNIGDNEIPQTLTDLGIVDGQIGQVLTTDGNNNFNFVSLTSAIGYAIDGGGGEITPGLLGAGLIIPFSCTITSVTLLADQIGSIVIDIWKDTYSSYPPTVADSICASDKPTLSSAIKSENTTLTGWTKTIAAGDVLRLNVDSADTVQNVTLILKVTKT